MTPSVLTPAVGAPYDERANLGRHWWLFLILGLVSVIVGIIAISSPFVPTLVSVMVFGVLLLIAGVGELIHAFMVRHLKGFALHVLGAALYLIAGLFMVEDPLRAAVVITLLLAAYLVVAGVMRILFALSVPFVGRGWVLFNGVVDLVLAGLIWSGWPESSLWVIGLFIGIDLLFHGWSWVIMALTVRTVGAAPSLEAKV